MFSKHPIVDVYVHQYTLNGTSISPSVDKQNRCFFCVLGFPHKIQHGDYFCGKLICLCKILIHNSYRVNFYTTHLHANYHKTRQEDFYLAHRTCQAYEVVQFIESTSNVETTDLTILLGDLNLTVKKLTVKL